MRKILMVACAAAVAAVMATPTQAASWKPVDEDWVTERLGDG